MHVTHKLSIALEETASFPLSFLVCSDSPKVGVLNTSISTTSGNIILPFSSLVFCSQGDKSVHFSHYLCCHSLQERLHKSFQKMPFMCYSVTGTPLFRKLLLHCTFLLLFHIMNSMSIFCCLERNITQLFL